VGFPTSDTKFIFKRVSLPGFMDLLTCGLLPHPTNVKSQAEYNVSLHESQYDAILHYCSMLRGGKEKKGVRQTSPQG
jgi:hypothetical protein